MNFIKNLGGTLEQQYYAFRIMYWIDIIIASFVAISGQHEAALLLAVLGLILGSISNDKKLLMMNEQIMSNQNRIEDKINVLLGD